MPERPSAKPSGKQQSQEEDGAQLWVGLPYAPEVAIAVVVKAAIAGNRDNRPDRGQDPVWRNGQVRRRLSGGPLRGGADRGDPR